MMRIVVGVVCVMVWGVVAGCDDEPAVTTPAKKEAGATGSVVEIGRVTPLPPGRRTHVAAMGSGQTFWVQEADGRPETVFAINEGDLPVATKFGNVAVLEAMGESGAVGSIQALAAGSDERLYFYLAGSKGKRMWAAIGSFAPATGQTRIIADTAALARDSEMGDALALARGSIVRVGDVLWFWLRHDDGFALLSLDVTRMGAAPRRAFARLEGEGPRLTSAGEDLAAGPANNLAYLDRRDGRVWTIDSRGRSAALRDLGELPAGITAPSFDERGRLAVFANDGPPFRAPAESSAARLREKTPEYPALMLFEGDRRVTMGRGQFVAPASTNLRAMALPQLFRERAGWLAYDERSGELLRLRVVER